MRIAIAAALAATLAIVGAPAQAQVEVGVINSLSGNFAAFGERYRTGLQVALDEINANGGIKGQQLTLTIQDDRRSEECARRS